MSSFFAGAVGLMAFLVGAACLITFVAMVLHDLSSKRK